MNTVADRLISLIICQSLTRIHFLALLLAGLLVISLPLNAQSDGPITIGTITGQIQAPNLFLPFTEYLESRLPEYEFEVEGFSTIDALIRAVEDNAVDLAFITPVALAEINLESELRVLATITQPAGNTFLPGSPVLFSPVHPTRISRPWPTSEAARL